MAWAVSMKDRFFIPKFVGFMIKILIRVCHMSEESVIFLFEK
jgi:hypothetical protein